MRKWNAYIAALVLLFVTTQIKGQYDPSFTHYWMMEPQYNPAAAGSTDNMRIVGTYSAQMSGYEDAPKTMYFGADLPAFFLKPNHGMGASFLNDEIGLFSHKRFSFQYAYRFKLFGGKLGLGAQVDLLNESFDGSKVDVEDSNDPAFASSDVNGSHVDAAFGVYYQHKNWYAGLSAQHLTAPTVTMGETSQLKVDRTYYFTAGYNINLRNPFLTIKPSVLAMYDGKEYRADLSGRVEYANDDKMLFGGATYSPENSVAVFVGGKFHGVVLSYSYEAYTNGVGMDHGAHELVLSYEMKLNLYKKGKNLHKSVRLL
jgi:type IX secretion system PorP/SprF family membrane protein